MSTTISSTITSAPATGLRARTTALTDSITATTVVNVGEIAPFSLVESEGREHNLGVVRLFAQHPLLAHFLADQPRGLQLTWARLEPGEELIPHVHPIDSMVVVANGRGTLLGGKVESPLKEGDVILVPRTFPHGFRGGAPEGLTAVSFQFGERSLYGDLEDPLVRFLDDAPVAPEQVVDFAMLSTNNERYRQRFRRFLEAEFVVTPWLRTKSARSTFLSYLRLWSDAFQRILMLRASFAEAPSHAVIAYRHLAEEFGHNTMLQAGGSAKEAAWDPAYEGSLAWFQWKALRSSDAEKIVLVNLVAEGAADEFYALLSKELDPEQMSAHFKAHHGVDGTHEQMGADLLLGLPSAEYGSLARLQQQGWEMMTRIIHRGAELSRAATTDLGAQAE